MTTPLVSVVVSTYANERLIRGCLELLERQTISRRLEIIVVDSGSPEDERSVVEDLQRLHGNISYLRTPRETLYAAWNRALAISTGRYFVNFNTDDWIREDALEIFAGALDTYPHTDIAYCDWAITFNPHEPADERDMGHLARHPGYTPALALFYCYGGCTQFWRRTSLERLGGFDPSFRACGDLDVLCRLVRARGSATLVPQVLTSYTQNQAGISLATDVSALEQRAIFEAARSTTPIDCLYRVDPMIPESVAAAWTALGNMALQVRVPWARGPLNLVDFALACFDRALEAESSFELALHNRYCTLFVAGRIEEAEQSLRHLPSPVAARVRGDSLDVWAADVEPAVRGPVFGQ